MIALAYILSLVHAGPIDKSVGFAARWATKEKMLPNLRRWLHYYFLVRGFDFLCLIKFGRVAGEADVECVEVVHLHQLLVEPAAMRGLKTLKCSLYVKCKLS